MQSETRYSNRPLPNVPGLNISLDKLIRTIKVAKVGMISKGGIKYVAVASTLRLYLYRTINTIERIVEITGKVIREGTRVWVGGIVFELSSEVDAIDWHCQLENVSANAAFSKLSIMSRCSTQPPSLRTSIQTASSDSSKISPLSPSEPYPKRTSSLSNEALKQSRRTSEATSLALSISSEGSSSSISPVLNEKKLMSMPKVPFSELSFEISHENLSIYKPKNTFYKFL